MRRYGRVTLVEVVVENDDRWPRRVRITSELDGPMWPPRTRGVPEPEFDGGTISTRVGPGERRSFGFASPAEPVEPPVSVASDPAATDGGEAIAPADLIRVLGDPRPPRDAVPGAGNGAGGPADDERADGERGAKPTDPACSSRGSRGRTSVDERERVGSAATPERDRRPRSAPGPPPAVGAWLAAVQTRIDDGRDGTAPDPRVLRAVADRAGSLADRLKPAGGRSGRRPERDGAVGRDGVDRP